MEARHDTPEEVARALARHVPKKLRSVLEPAVGRGALLVPVLRRISENGRVIVIDSDPSAITFIQGVIQQHSKASVKSICKSFLDLRRATISGTWRKFDCVIMNPPFAARRSSLVPVVILDAEGVTQRHCVPLEAAFVLHAMQFLRDGGKLLSVLPCSVVMSEGLGWLRQYLSSKGSIQYVHELPPRTFPCVGSRMYLFVFAKGITQKRVMLCNHDLAQPERMYLDYCADVSGIRLDYGFNNARRLMDEIVDASSCEWESIGNLAEILRGTANSPEGPTYALHTTDYRAGFWRSHDRHKLKPRTSGIRVEPGDIVVKRVGRDCALSFGRGIGITRLLCTDCLLVIRPRTISESTSLLLGLMSLREAGVLQPLTERGTGASYVCESAIAGLRIPLKMRYRFPQTYKRFADAVARRDGNEMVRSARAVVQAWNRALDR